MAAALGGLIGFGLHPSAETPAPLALSPVLGKSEPASSGADLQVHVVGEVKSPGIYRMPPGSRVADAIEKAGGGLKTADTDQLNLAMRVEDGVQVRVPAKGQIVPDGPAVAGELPANPFAGSITPVAIGRPRSAHASSNTASAKPAARSISLNSAGAAELDRLPGVGPSTAAKIIEYRREHGGFSSIDELLAVKGIGDKKLADMRPYLRL